MGQLLTECINKREQNSAKVCQVVKQSSRNATGERRVAREPTTYIRIHPLLWDKPHPSYCEECCTEAWVQGKERLSHPASCRGSQLVYGQGVFVAHVAGAVEWAMLNGGGHRKCPKGTYAESEAKQTDCGARPNRFARSIRSRGRRVRGPRRCLVTAQQFRFKKVASP